LIGPVFAEVRALTDVAHFSTTCGQIPLHVKYIVVLGTTEVPRNLQQEQILRGVTPARRAG